MRLDSAQTSRMTRGQRCVFHGRGSGGLAYQSAMDGRKMILDACALPGLTWLAGAPGRIRTRDPLLRRSIQAGGQPARTQVGGCSWCPWATAGDRSFPSVLAREWHGACRSRSRHAAGGIVDSVSSKAARLRRRQAARRKQEKRQRKSGRVPQHTRAERRREAAERQRQR